MLRALAIIIASIPTTNQEAKPMRIGKIRDLNLIE